MGTHVSTGENVCWSHMLYMVFLLEHFTLALTHSIQHVWLHGHTQTEFCTAILILIKNSCIHAFYCILIEMTEMTFRIVMMNCFRVQFVHKRMTKINLHFYLLYLFYNCAVGFHYLTLR